MSNLNQKKRKCISLETKVEIIKKHCEQKIATSILSKEYSVNTSTISTILSSKEKILEHFEKNLCGTEKKRIKLSSLKKHFEKKNFFAHLFQCNFDITSNEISAQLAQGTVPLGSSERRSAFFSASLVELNPCKN
ncbi:hypothetical protein BpHYR1_027771 [Brachionus plicatilis]|uniref:Uncharacterized protein n=1 Tax=Brachionus plicatilis TaxID=10195 RepID=A0A3M7PQ85_BRAPC|nr:hypothetical protein BpHYR1_027771 [Brachionus plicatilis]